MEEYLRFHRLLYDPARGIPIETMNPQRPDWKTLGLQSEPPPGLKPIDAKRKFEKEQQARLKSKHEVAKIKAKKAPVKKTTPPPLPPAAAQQAKTKAVSAAASAAPTKRGRAITPTATKVGPAKRKPVSPTASQSSSEDDDGVEETLSAIRTPATRCQTVSWVYYCCFSKLYSVRRVIRLPSYRHSFKLCRFRHVKNVRRRTSVIETRCRPCKRRYRRLNRN